MIPPRPKDPFHLHKLPTELIAMKCPSCSKVDLLMTERKGIEIDYWPKCRGVWLDRGELDQFVQQSELFDFD